ncbi:MAG TPA: hypothetical protein VGP73_02340 [Thermoanaerobaculia bacterium]
MRWLEAKLLAGLGQTAKAENAFKQARGEFLELGRLNSAAHLQLALLPVLFRQGKHQEARKNAYEACCALRELGHGHCAAKARLYLQ